MQEVISVCCLCLYLFIDCITADLPPSPSTSPPTPPRSLSGGSTAAIAGGAAGGLFLLLIIVIAMTGCGFYLYFKHNYKRNGM